ncbi:MAG: L-type lectin-domain containing protein [Phycisphaerales bacterium]
MKTYSRLLSRCSRAAFSLAVAALAPAASAGNITFPDFSDTAGLTLNGNAAVVNTIDGDVLRLVPALGGQSGSFFGNTPVDALQFASSFQFRISNPGGISDGVEVGADGFCFVIQPISSGVGGAGGGLGYQGITPSVAVEFDTFTNGEFGDLSSNHVGVDLNGDVNSVAQVAVVDRLDNADLWSAWVDYDGVTLRLFIDPAGGSVRPIDPVIAHDVNIPAVIGQDTAFIGFTAGTGSAWGDHDIVNWNYDSTVPTPGPATLATLAGLMGLRRRR